MNAAQIRQLIPDNVLLSFLKQKKLVDFDGELIVRAIDIGFGYTKFTKGIDSEGAIITSDFPSVAAVSPNDDLSGEFFVSRDTVKIENGGTIWEIGPDVNEVSSRSEVRVMNENFVSSEQWKVLFLGALAYIDCESIDVLVLGLPVNHMGKKDIVTSIAKGTHSVNGKTCEVKEVLVIPQPLGALYNHAIKSENFDQFIDTNSLIIDPGYLTFDFLVAKGFSVNGQRSGARPGSMNAILTAIAKSISAEIQTEFDDLNEIDKALNLKNYGGAKEYRPVRIYGEEHNLTKHITNTKVVIDSSINFMLNKIVDKKDINLVIMAGGPNVIFEKSIKAVFNKTNVLTIPDGMYANVVGFMLWGLMVAYGNRMKKEK